MASPVFGLHNKEMSSYERRRERESSGSSMFPVILTLIIIALVLGVVCVLAF